MIAPAWSRFARALDVLVRGPWRERELENTLGNWRRQACHWRDALDGIVAELAKGGAGCLHRTRLDFDPKGLHVKINVERLIAILEVTHGWHPVVEWLRAKLKEEAAVAELYAEHKEEVGPT